MKSLATITKTPPDMMGPDVHPTLLKWKRSKKIISDNHWMQGQRRNATTRWCNKGSDIEDRRKEDGMVRKETSEESQKAGMDDALGTGLDETLKVRLYRS